MVRISRTALAAGLTLVRRTDTARWKRNVGEEPVWDDRNVRIAGLVPDHCSVLDVGAGAQTLRRHLKPGCRYQPCDLVQSSPDVILCDFNRGIFPDLGGKSFDYVVCSGVLEYMRQLEGFVARVRCYGRNLILTYNVREEGSGIVDRLALGWVNHLTLSEIDDLFTRCGLTTMISAIRRPSEYIFSARATDAG